VLSQARRIGIHNDNGGKHGEGHTVLVACADAKVAAFARAPIICTLPTNRTGWLS